MNREEWKQNCVNGALHWKCGHSQLARRFERYFGSIDEVPKHNTLRRSNGSLLKFNLGLRSSWSFATANPSNICVSTLEILHNNMIVYMHVRSRVVWKVLLVNLTGGTRTRFWLHPCELFSEMINPSNAYTSKFKFTATVFYTLMRVVWKVLPVNLDR